MVVKNPERWLKPTTSDHCGQNHALTSIQDVDIGGGGGGGGYRGPMCLLFRDCTVTV